MSAAPPPSARRAVLGLAGSSVLATVLTFAVQPVLTRLFSAESFGTADLYGAVLGVLFPIASLRYEDALVLPDDDRDAAHLFWLCVLLTLGTCGLVALVPLFGAALTARLPGYAALGPYLVWLAPGLLVLRWSRILEAYLARGRRFAPISTGNVVRAGVTGGHRLALGLAGDAGGVLVVSQVSGSAVAALVQTAALGPLGRDLWQPVEGARMRALARRYRRFALLTTPSSLLASLATRLPFLLLAAFYPAAVVGLFGRVYLALAVPLSFVTGAASRVLAVEAAEGRRAGTLAAVAARYHTRLVALGLWPALALVVAGPDLFAVVFGPAWREAGVFAQITAPWLMLAATASALSPLFDVTEQHRRDLATTALLFLGTAAVLTGAHLAGATPRTALTALGATGALLRGLHVLLLLRVAHTPLRAIARPYRALRRVRPARGAAAAARRLAGPARAHVCRLLARRGRLRGARVAGRNRTAGTGLSPSRRISRPQRSEDRAERRGEAARFGVGLGHVRAGRGAIARRGSAAVGLEGAHEVGGNGARRAAFDVAALDHEHRLTVLQERHEGRGGRDAREVAAGLRGGLHVLPGKYGHVAVRLHIGRAGEGDGRPGVGGGAAAHRVDDEQRRAGRREGGVHRVRRAQFFDPEAGQLLAHGGNERFGIRHSAQGDRGRSANDAAPRFDSRR